MLRPTEMSDAQGGSVARALVNPVGVGVAAGAATVAIALTNPVIGIVGGGVYLASVAIDAIRRARKKRKRKRSAIVNMPDPDDIKDPNTKAAVKKMVANKLALQRILDETPPDVLLHLSKTTASLDEMESYAVRLVERAEEITKYLANVNLPALVQEVKQLATRASTARDPEARASFDQAKDARMDEIRSLKDLRAQKDRVDANLMRVVAVLGSLPTKVVRLRALDAQAMDQLSGDISHDLDAVGEELKTSEQVIRQLVPQ
jgi:hypothetical protein